MTKQLFDKDLNQYATSMSSTLGDLLYKLERQTYQKVLKPIMLSGRLQGSLLQIISKMLEPQFILDIGTFTGYSAICLAQGLTVNGVLHTIDNDEELFDMAKSYFIEANLVSRIEQHLGNALEIIPTLDYPWDLVFLDADKTNYYSYYKLLIENLKSGAVIIADNVLFEGRVLNSVDKQHKNEKAIHEFNLKIKDDNRVEVVLLPIRDGISIIRKK